jgi:hypothetical protein
MSWSMNGRLWLDCINDEIKSCNRNTPYIRPQKISAYRIIIITLLFHII